MMKEKKINIFETMMVIVFVFVVGVGATLMFFEMEVQEDLAENRCEQTCFNNNGFVKEFDLSVCECISYTENELKYFNNRENRQKRS